jgi:hypothetical protein
MRCSTCGTENAPDSRFCGGCGARQPSSEQRLAPTAKIPDDAQYPSSSASPTTTSGKASPKGPVSYAPPSIPPPATATPAPGSLVRPASEPNPYGATGPQQPVSRPPAQPSKPPTSQNRSVSAQRPAPHVSSASGSIAVPPQRPVGLIVLVLLVDLGLAATGGVLLSKGLGAKDEPKKSETIPVEKKSAIETPLPPPAAPASAGVVAPPGLDSGPAPAVEPAPFVAAREAPTDKRETSATKPARVDKPVTSPREPADKPKPVETPVDKPIDTPDEAKPVGLVPTHPQDPYAVPNTEQELDAAAARSKATFAKCAADHQVRGAIKIAYQVSYDGRVINAAAVENSTGNDALARCLVAEISTWKVSAHNGTALDFLRPFTYP